MALIQCTHCHNEFDNYDAKCPYCGAASAPLLKNFKPLILCLAIVCLLGIGAFVVMNEEFSLQQIWNTATSTSQVEQRDAPSPERDTLVERPQEGSSARAEQNVAAIEALSTADASLLTSIEVVDLYTAYIYQALAGNTSVRLTGKPVETSPHRFTYTLSDQTTVVLALNNDHTALRSVTLKDAQEKTFIERVGGVRGVFFAAVLSSDVEVAEINAQLDYLQQWLNISQKDEVSYDFEGHQLAARYERNKESISILLMM